MTDIVTALQSLRATYPPTQAGTDAWRAAVRGVYAQQLPGALTFVDLDPSQQRQALEAINKLLKERANGTRN